MRGIPEQVTLKLSIGPQLVLAVFALIGLLGLQGCKSKAEEDPTATAEETVKGDPSYLEASAVATKFADEF